MLRPTIPGMKTPEQLRSHRWFGDNRADSVRAFSHRSRMRGLGVTAEEHEGKPIIAILNTWSGINPCHQHLRERAEQVRRGVLEAGGFPVEMPVATLSETFQKPTPMMYRNLLSMETEELLRSYPFDGAVLMGGCDKTTPALIMGAASANIPAIFVPAGPDAQRQLPGTASRQRHRHVAGLGRLPGRRCHRLRPARPRRRHRPVAWPLHDDGHRLDDDQRRRSARHDAARRRVDPRRRLRPLPDGRQLGQAHRRHGSGTTRHPPRSSPARRSRTRRRPCSRSAARRTR